MRLLVWEDCFKEGPNMSWHTQRVRWGVLLSRWAVGEIMEMASRLWSRFRVWPRSLLLPIIIAFQKLNIHFEVVKLLGEAFNSLQHAALIHSVVTDTKNCVLSCKELRKNPKEMAHLVPVVKTTACSTACLFISIVGHLLKKISHLSPLFVCTTRWSFFLHSHKNAKTLLRSTAGGLEVPCKVIYRSTDVKELNKIVIEQDSLNKIIFICSTILFGFLKF